MTSKILNAATALAALVSLPSSAEGAGKRHRAPPPAPAGSISIPDITKENYRIPPALQAEYPDCPFTTDVNRMYTTIYTVTRKTDEGCLFYIVSALNSQDVWDVFTQDDVYLRWEGSAPCTPGQYINGFGTLVERNDNQHNTANHKPDPEVRRLTGLMDHGFWQGGVQISTNEKNAKDINALNDAGVEQYRGGFTINLLGNPSIWGCLPHPKGELASQAAYGRP